MTGARIVHLSDLHVGRSRRLWLKPRSRGGFATPDEEGLVGLADAIAALDPAPAAFVVSGDITADGHPDDFRPAFDYLLGRARMPSGARAGLDAVPRAVVVIPGNHDVWNGGLLRGTVRARSSRRAVLGRSDWRPHPAPPARPTDPLQDPCLPPPPLLDLDLGQVGEVAYKARLEVIVLDSTMPNPINFFAVGWVPGRSINAVRSWPTLNEIRGVAATAASPVPSPRTHVYGRLAVMHHPPQYRGLGGARIRLLNGGAVRDALAAARVSAVLSGHEHHVWVSTLEGRMLQSVAGTGPRRGRPLGFVTIDVEPPAKGLRKGGPTPLPMSVTEHRWVERRSAYVPGDPRSGALTVHVVKPTVTHDCGRR